MIYSVEDSFSDFVLNIKRRYKRNYNLEVESITLPVEIFSSYVELIRYSYACIYGIDIFCTNDNVLTIRHKEKAMQD